MPSNDFVRLRTQPGARPPSDALVDFPTAARASGLSVKQIRDACHEARLNVVMVGRKPCVTMADVDALKAETADAQSET
jgi:hypothetical protein